jgi:hypothetical protein
VHVGQKASIDLSTDALDLDSDVAADGTQLRLCAKSDGIEFQVDSKILSPRNSGNMTKVHWKHTLSLRL